MPKPLVSNEPNPKDIRFSHFGVLDDGKRSKGAAFTSLAINLSILLLIFVLGLIVKTNPEVAKKLTLLTLAPKPPEVKPIPKPPPPPLKPLPTPPKIKLEPPKIKLPEPVLEKVPDIKPMIVPVPKPVVLNTPAPKAVNPPPAPKVVNLSTPKAASIANNDAHPSAVRLGNPEIKALNGPSAVTPVNLAGGMHGMPASNTGSGPHATAVNMGSGSPAGTDVAGKGRGPVVVKGLNTGVTGSTGTGPNRGPVQVQMQQAPVAQAARPVAVATAVAPKLVLIYKPEPVYTPEAKALHLEGTVTLHIKVLSSGAVQVLGLVRGLGHGLDESAETATRATRFKPPVDGNGNPTEFETNVIVRFQLS